MRQRVRINIMNCGGLLQIRADKLVSRELLKFLYDRVHPGTMIMDLEKDRSIHITPFAVKQVFGLPDSGEELSLLTNQQSCKALSDFKHLIGLQDSMDVHTKYLHEIWEADSVLESRMFDDDMSIRIFFIIASNKLLFPSSDNNIRAKDVYLTRNLSRLPSMNWCKAIIDELRDAIRTWKLDRRRKVFPSISGCAIFLLVSFTYVIIMSTTTNTIDRLTQYIIVKPFSHISISLGCRYCIWITYNAHTRLSIMTSLEPSTLIKM